jgi:hypothetical protein
MRVLTSSGVGGVCRLAAATLFSLVVLTHAVETRAAVLQGSFGGHAYGAHASGALGLGSFAIDRAANRALACEGTKGRTRSATLNGLSAGPDKDVMLGTMRSSVFSEKTATSAVVRNVARVSAVDLLGGIITADAVRAVASINATESSMSHSANGSRFENLSILGNLIPANVAPNTTIPLPGLGSVTLKRVVPLGNFVDRGRVTVEMISIAIAEANAFSLPVGAKIVVAHAVAGFNRDAPDLANVGGSAYLSEANSEVGEDVQNSIGRLAALHLSCGGTDGRVRTREAATLTVDNILALGEGTTTAFSDETETATVATMTADVEGVHLLGGIVTIGAVRAVASDRFESGVRTSSTAGTRISNLSVAGLPLGNVTDENVRIDVPLVGYIILNEVTPPTPGTRQRLRVNGARLVVESLGALLPVGSEIIIGHAESTTYD